MHRHSAMWEYKHVYIYLLASVQRKSFLQCLAFGQAEASINLLAQMSFQLAPKAFGEQNWFHSSSIIQIPQKTSLACLAS